MNRFTPKLQILKFTPQLFFGGFILCLGLGQFGRWHITSHSAIYLHDLLLSVWLSWYLIQDQGKVIWKTLKHHPWWTAALSWFTLSLVLNTWWGMIHITSWLYAIRLAVYGTWLCYWWAEKRLSRTWLAWGILGLATWWSVFGLVQYTLFPDMRFLSIYGWDDHYYRLIGTQLDPNLMGLLLVIIWLAVIMMQLPQRGKTALLVPLTSCIALTFSRSTYVSWFVGVSLLFLIKNTTVQGKQIVLLAVWGLTVLWLAPKPTGEGVDLTRTTSIIARTSATTAYLEKPSVRHIVLGHGLFAPAPASKTTQNYTYDHANVPDNSLVMIWYYGGIGGSVLVLLAVVQSWFKTRQKSQSVWIIGGAIFSHSLFNGSLTQAFVILTAGIVLKYLQSERNSNFSLSSISSLINRFKF